MIRKEMFRGMALGLAFTMAATSVSPINSVYASDEPTSAIEENSTVDESDKMVGAENSTLGADQEGSTEEVATPSDATPAVTPSGISLFTATPSNAMVSTVSSGDAAPVEEKVTVTFTTNLNILNKEVLGDVEVTKGETVTPPELLAVGRKVTGWFTTMSCDAGTEFDFSQPVTESIKLYPKFENAVAEITMMADGEVYGTKSMGVNNTIYLDEIGIPEIKPGYRFAGWTYDEEGTQYVEFGTDRFADNTNIYAQFVPFIYLNITSESDYVKFITLITGDCSNTNYEPDYSFVYDEAKHNKQGLLPKAGGSTMDYDYIVNNYSGDELEEVLEAYHELAYVYLYNIYSPLYEKYTFSVYDKEFSGYDFVNNLVDPYWEDATTYYDEVNSASKNKASKFDLSKIVLNIDIHKETMTDDELKSLNEYGSWKSPNKAVKEVLGTNIWFDIYDNDSNKVEVSIERADGSLVDTSVTAAIALDKSKFTEDEANRIIYNIAGRDTNGGIVMEQFNYGGENHYVDFFDNEVNEGCCRACALNYSYNFNKPNGDFTSTDDLHTVRFTAFGVNLYTVIYDNTCYEMVYMVDGEVYHTQEVMYETEPTAPTDPTKEGEIFKEWKEVGWTTKEDSVLGTVNVVTYEAVFEAEKKNYTVKFIADGEETGSQTIEENKTAEDSVEAPAKEGYKFLYWTYNGVEYDFSTPITGDIDLEAKYEINEYEVKLNYGDKLEKTETITKEWKEKVAEPVVDAVIKDNTKWEVTGWTVNNEPYDFSEPVTSNIEIIAKWEAKEYLVQFDSDGGTEIKDQWSENKKVTKPENPVKEGSTFKYWELDGAEFKFTSEITKPVTLKAVYEINKFNVTFDSDGGTEVEKQVVEYNKSAEKPAAPEKVGYTFKYWVYKQADGTEVEYKFDTKVTSDVKLKAVYEINTYTVKFDTVGGTKVDDQKIQYNNRVAYPKNPEKEGYRFRYWTLNGEKFDFTTKVTSDMEIVAFYEIKEYTVTILPYTGSTGKMQLNVEYLDKVNRPDDPEMEGYKFLYWSCNGEEYDFNTPVKQNITIKAVYEKLAVKKYTVTFDSNGGTSVSKQTVEEGKMVPRPNNPRKTKYKFLYWELNGQEYTFNQPVTSDMTLKAVWESLEPITTPEAKEDKDDEKVTHYCDIVFDSDGGTKVSNQRIENGSKVSKPKEPEKEGYNFVGWYLGSRVFNFAEPVVSNLHLKAKWEEVQEPIQDEPINNQPTEETPTNPDNKDTDTVDDIPVEDVPVEDEPIVDADNVQHEDTDNTEEPDNSTSEDNSNSSEDDAQEEPDNSNKSDDNKVVIENNSDEVELTAAEKIIEGLKKVLIGFSICLLGLLGILGILFLIWLFTRRVKIYNNTDSSDYEDESFELVLKTFIKNEENKLFGTFLEESFKKDVVKTFVVNIPDYITDNEMTNEYYIELTKRFVKKHNGETIIIKFEGLNKEQVHTIVEDNTEIRFNS